MIKVYRFNDQVALHFEGQPTVYLDVKDAIELTRVLGRFTTDIRMKSYQDSNLSNVYYIDTWVSNEELLELWDTINQLNED